MIDFPSFETFQAAWAQGKNQLIWVKLAADLDTPVSLMLKLGGAGKDSFMLESVTGGEIRGRYSAVGLMPDVIWRCTGRHSQINRDVQTDEGAFTAQEGHPFETLRALLAESAIDMPEGLPPVAAGVFGYLGYDMIRLVEDLPHVNTDVLGVPDALLVRPSVVAVLDGVKGEVILASPAWAASGLSAQEAYDQAKARVMDALERLERGAPHGPPILGSAKPASHAAAAVSNLSKEAYKSIVETAKDYIRAGDIFQVVPSQRWTQRFTQPPFALYRALRQTNPSPFMFFFNFGEFQVVGASPEILVRLRGGEVTVRPIAGTRPRGATPADDLALEKDLLGDPKEMAEHLMLLDLGRNDVGRVSQIGSVAPTERFIIERYSHVMHIVSNVVGKIKPGEDGLSALLAGLPAGTVSGAPKVRAMEIIDELEPEKRGIYGGGIGYFAANGEMDFCIALRTSVLKDQNLYVQAGGGVVYDSDPEAEWQEAVNKSKALFRAAEKAREFSGGN